MRILSLLPSATEIVYALGLGDSLVGVTAECDEPPEAMRKPVVSFPALSAAVGAGVSAAGTGHPAAVDEAVKETAGAGRPLYRLDEDHIRALRPDLVLAQDLCNVCATPSGDVTAVLERLGMPVEVLSLDPGGLEDVLECVVQVGAAAGADERAAALAGALRARVDAVRRATAGARARRVLVLEWSDPPWVAGNWVPDMVQAAGGTPALVPGAGVPSRRADWEEVAAARAEVVVFAPCGYHLAAATAEGAGLATSAALAHARDVWAVDGSAFFSRPGPRLVDGVELLSWVLHPARVPAPPEGRAHRLR